MDVESDINDANEENSHVIETDDSCRFGFIERASLARDNDSAYTSESRNGDWSAEIKQENMDVVRQKPDGVCCVSCVALLRTSGSLHQLFTTISVVSYRQLLP